MTKKIETEEELIAYVISLPEKEWNMMDFFFPPSQLYVVRVNKNKHLAKHLQTSQIAVECAPSTQK